MKTNIDKKIKKLLDTYLSSIFMVCYYDCCDSSHTVEKTEYAFNILVDDKITIQRFIEEYYFKEYIKAWQDYYNEYLKDSDYFTDNYEAIKEPSCGNLPICFDKMEKFVTL